MLRGMPQALMLSVLLLFGLLYHGYLLGLTLFPKKNWMISLAPGCLLFLALQSLVQTAWYYSGGLLGQKSDIASLLIAAFIAQIIRFAHRRKEGEGAVEDAPEPAPQTKIQRVITVLLFFVAAAGTGFILKAALGAATTESIRTPWPLLPPETLPTIILIWLTLFLSVWFIRSPFFAAVHSVLAIGSTVSIAPLLYRLGFGFDGFLHIASEKIIAASGTLNPKPFYYIGQYVFTTWLARMADLPLSQIDRWLVPASAALLIPASLYLALGDQGRCVAGFTALALLPLSGFVATTPQSFAYILGLSALFLSLGMETKRVRPAAPLILAVWSAAVHPLAGIPILFVTAALISNRLSRPTLRRLATTVSLFLAGAAVPLLFYLISLRSNTPISWNAASLLDTRPWFDRLAAFLPLGGNHFVLWPAWTNLATRAVPLLLLTLSLAGMGLNHDTALRRRQLIFIAAASALWIAATILKATGDFTFLIDYERSNYTDRLNILAILCLVPAAAFGLAFFWERALRSPYLARMAAIGFFLALTAGLAYDSLPRHDAVIAGRGWSTSRYDVEAVRLIDRDAEDRDYVVLANQSVSAAAVTTFGFKRYADDVFFYPIPTGGPLYEIFLRMMYRVPTRDTAKDAAELGRTDLVYVVLNKYWWRADALAEVLRENADRNWTLGENDVRLYKFDLRKSSSAPSETSGR